MIAVRRNGIVIAVAENERIAKEHIKAKLGNRWDWETEMDCETWWETTWWNVQQIYSFKEIEEWC